MRITSSIVLATENSILVVPKFWECIYPQYSWIRSFRNIVFLASRLLSAHLRSYSIPGLFCYDKYSFNLFHFYVDMLPKLCFAENSSCKRLYIPSSLSGFTHVMEITQLLGFECIFFDERPLNIFVSSRLVSHQGYSFSTFRSCRDNILSKLESRLTHEPILTQQILFISRSDASRRQLLNENELITYIEESYGITLYKVTPSLLPLFDQINLFRSATAVIGLHGAGLSNIMFCAEGTKVIELALSHSDNICYQYLSSALGLEHIFSYIDTSEYLDPHNDNITLSVNSIEQIAEHVSNVLQNS